MDSPSLCAAAGNVYQGHGTTCGLVDCTEPPGACCDVFAVCTDGVKQSDCQGTFDTFFELQACSEVSCPPARGACCSQAGGCLQFQNQDFCENTLGGTYAGDGTDCNDQVCDPGACCLPDGSCQEIIEAECDALGGAFGAVGSSCATAGCPQPQGACCVNQTCVPSQLEADCISFNGTWLGPFTTCGLPNPCAVAATIVGASSCRDHGSNPSVERCLSLDTLNVEPRLGGVRKLVFQVSDPVSAVGASVACAVNTYDGVVTVTPNGTTVTVDLSSGLPGGDCCTITLTGEVDDSFDVRVLVGDTNRDGAVSSADAASAKQRLGSQTQSAGAQYDVNLDEAISSADASSIKQRLGSVVAACP
jgi:hypothetical protein